MVHMTHLVLKDGLLLLRSQARRQWWLTHHLPSSAWESRGATRGGGGPTRRHRRCETSLHPGSGAWLLSMILVHAGKEEADRKYV